MRRLAAAVSLLLGTVLCAAEVTTVSQELRLQDDKASQVLRAFSGDRELFAYNYADSLDLPHFFPLNTPSGKNLLVQKTEPYPHHRSFWVSDTVERDGIRGDIYNAYYSGVKVGKRQHQSPFNTRSRHEAFSNIRVDNDGNTVAYEEKLVWETSATETAFPLLNEYRQVTIHNMDDGSYLINFGFRLSADYGDVKFVSDAVHYAWPYLRINSQFSGDGGGTITSDTGTTGQIATNLKPHRWIDYSNSVNEVTEGVAVFQTPNGETPKWLTREYGTFGPRRTDDKSGKPFTLSRGESLEQRVGVYVHKGNVHTGNVADVYKRYAQGEFSE